MNTKCSKMFGPSGYGMKFQSFVNRSDPVATDRSLSFQPNAVHCRGVLSVFTIDTQSIRRRLAVGIP